MDDSSLGNLGTARLELDLLPILAAVAEDEIHTRSSKTAYETDGDQRFGLCMSTTMRNRGKTERRSMPEFAEWLKIRSHSCSRVGFFSR